MTERAGLCRVAVTKRASLGNGTCRSGDTGFPSGNWFFCEKSPDPAKEPRVSQSAMPVLSRALVPEVLPAVMADAPAVPEMLPAPLPELALPA